MPLSSQNLFTQFNLHYTYDRLIDLASCDGLISIWKSSSSPWDRMAFERILRMASYDQLRGIWKNSSFPWDKEAFEAMLPRATDSELRSIYRDSSSPWDIMAKAELQRRGSWQRRRLAALRPSGLVRPPDKQKCQEYSVPDPNS